MAPSTAPLRAVQFGVGPIGELIVRTAVERGLEFVGAIDVDPAKVGFDLGAAAGVGTDLGVRITDAPADALSADPDVVFHSTTSSLVDAAPQLEAAMAVGADVISTCEELAFPWWDQPGTAARLDEVAIEHGVTCLGTGVNPGFVMDALPAVLSTACRRVRSVRVERVQDAAARREPLRAKIGVGLRVEAFDREVRKAGGHVGLTESTAMLADALGWGLTGIEETIEPVIAEEQVNRDGVTVEAGEVAGIHQTAVGWQYEEPRIELDLTMAFGAPNPRDVITVSGDPEVGVTVEGGLHGDVTTPAVVVNVVPAVRDGDPGLATMTRLRVPSFSVGPAR